MKPQRIKYIRGLKIALAEFRSLQPQHSHSGYSVVNSTVSYSSHREMCCNFLREVRRGTRVRLREGREAVSQRS